MQDYKTTNHFANNLSKELKRQKIKKNEFAKNVGITPQSLTYYCNGKRIPPLNIAINIAQNLNVSLDQLCSTKNNQYITNQKEECLINLFKIFNKAGQTFLLDLIETVAHDPKYIDQHELNTLKNLIEKITNFK